MDYLSRYPTFSAPAPSNYNERFVVKSIEPFNKALTFIISYSSHNSSDGFCHPSQEGVNLSPRHSFLPSSKHSPVGGDRKLPRSVNQSNHVMQICPSSFSPIEGVKLSSKNVSQSETSMLIKNHRPVSLT